MISISMRVSDILLRVQSKQLSYLLPLKKTACNLMDTIVLLIFKNYVERRWHLSPSPLLETWTGKILRRTPQLKNKLTKTGNFP